MTFEPTWRRLVATTVVCFALVLALLAWRLQTGHDPALGATTTAAVTTTTSTDTSATTDDSSSSDQSSSSGDSSANDGSSTMATTGAS